MLGNQIPKTKKEVIREMLHGVEVRDSYRWLEDIESKRVSRWLDEQNVYTRSTLDKLPHRDELQNEFKKLFYEETVVFPHPRNGRYFYQKRLPNEDLSVLYVREGLHGEPRVLVDPNELSREAGYPINLTDYSVSKDGKFVSYCLSESANDQSTLYFLNVDTGEKLADTIPARLYPSSGSWSRDNSGLWYTRRKEEVPEGEEKFHRKVYYHRFGTDYAEDELIFGNDLAKEDIPSAYETHDGQYVILSVFIYSEEHYRSELYLRTVDEPEQGFVPIVKNIRGNDAIYFCADIHRGYVYITTNYEAPRWKVMRVAVSDISRGMNVWEEVIGESDGVIESISLVRDSLFVQTLENVHSVLREYSCEGALKREIPFPTIGSGGYISAEPEGNEAFFSFTSFVFPTATYRIDLNTDEVSLFDQAKVNMDIDDIETQQAWFTSKDGTRVPMFLICRKDVEQTGVTPTLLYGYGGFNVSLTPSFEKSILPFVRRGGIYAVANIRGGNEFGEEWHKAGTKNQKQNVFDDFIAAAEWLIANNYTDSNHLAIEGRSNGGLLVGAVMTQRPELVKAVIMTVPVADMLRYHLFHGGRHWIPDYGSAEDPDMVPYLLGYSPYHNVRNETAYPATMVVTSDKDDRVHPGQAFKMAARLQEANASIGPILLRVERRAGHGGAADISRYIKSAVDEWSFLFWQLGIK